MTKEEAADGRKSLPEQVLSSSQATVMGFGVVHSEADAPHLVKRVDFSKRLSPVPKRFHLPVLRKLGISPSENGIFAFPLLNGMVETPDAPSYALLRSGL